MRRRAIFFRRARLCCLRAATVNRGERAARAKVAISSHFNSKQQGFLDFVLAHYVSVGVEELEQEKLTPLLRPNITTQFRML